MIELDTPTSEKCRVLFILKLDSQDAIDAAIVLALELLTNRKLEIYLESRTLNYLDSRLLSKVNIFNCETSKIDLIISLGGDGTTLRSVKLFQGKTVPKVIAVALGSLCYLNRTYVDEVSNLVFEYIENPNNASLKYEERYALEIFVYNKDGIVEGPFRALNECVIDRGACSGLRKLDVFINDTYYITVVADGIIIATPTGSTAYSMAAGASVVDPAVRCSIITPICPHSLSLRPIVIQASSLIKVRLNEDSRTDATIRVDGETLKKLDYDSHVTISEDKNPIVFLGFDRMQDLWLMSLKDNLFWGKTPVIESQNFSYKSRESFYIN